MRGSAIRQRRFLAVGLLVALLVAGDAAAEPLVVDALRAVVGEGAAGVDGVAGQTGFLDSADDPVDTGSPFADYGTKGVDDERLSGGIAGVAGVGLTLLIGGGLFWGLRRRPAPQQD
ncbi:MAG TPA: PDGLE domain-containing protein [Nocardioides sp.]|nr:PDGLE domain-containing protein [Nocardioides sp.]